MKASSILAENECNPGTGSGDGLIVEVKNVKSAGGQRTDSPPELRVDKRMPSMRRALAPDYRYSYVNVGANSKSPLQRQHKQQLYVACLSAGIRVLK